MDWTADERRMNDAEKLCLSQIDGAGNGMLINETQ